LLNRVLEFAEKIDLPPFQYSRGMKHWTIELDLDGNFQEVSPNYREDKKGKVELGNPNLPASPHLNRNGVAAKLLTDTAEYVLGIGEAEERAKRYCQAYLKLLEECYKATQEASITAVMKFLGNQPLPQLQAYLERYPTDWQLEKSHVIRFKVAGKDPTELKHIQKFWAEYCFQEDLPKQPCLVTGEIGAITMKLEHKLKSVPDTQGSGASLISAYCDSFHSYGRKGAEASPIGVDTAETLGQVLGYLESQSKHRLRIGSVLYLFWCAEAEFDLNDWFNEPSETDVEVLLAAIHSGNQYPPPVKKTDFYILALSGASGRVIVRDFLQTTVEQVKYALGRWFAAQSLVDLTGKTKAPIGIYALAAQAYRDAAKDLQSHTVVELSRCALQPNKPLPKDLLHKVLERVRVQRQPTYRQASLIKLILISWGINIAVNLDQRMENLNLRQKQAYCCGRLLATFSSIQYYALGSEVNKTVIDSAYGAAATTPSRIFGTLEVKVQNHLAELRKNKRGLAVSFSKQLEEIHAAMPGASFPNTLTLEEQGIFAMGYWHQKAFRPNSETAKESEVD
jgi:CRISPR-associated protein Csd1